jgi:MFS family permease
MMDTFHVDSEIRITLGLTSYLFGLAAGSVVLAPLSELYGRRPVFLVSMTMFVILVIPCALADSLNEIIGIRFLGAFFGSVTIANAP